MFKKFTGKYWIILGTISYLSILIYSLVLSIEKTSLFINLEITTDWAAASIIYFFIGAFFGFLIDYFKSEKNKKICLWVYLISLLWIVGIVFNILFAKEFKFILAVIFPLAYGIFFTGAAYTLVLPNFFKQLVYSKIYFDLIICSLFLFWGYFEIKDKNNIVKETSLIMLFIILIIGMIKSILIFLN